MSSFGPPRGKRGVTPTKRRKTTPEGATTRRRLSSVAATTTTTLAAAPVIEDSPLWAQGRTENVSTATPSAGTEILSPMKIVFREQQHQRMGEVTQRQPKEERSSSSAIAGRVGGGPASSSQSPSRRQQQQPQQASSPTPLLLDHPLHPPILVALEEERSDRSIVEQLLVAREEFHERDRLSLQQDHEYSMMASFAVAELEHIIREDKFQNSYQSLALDFKDPECFKRRTQTLYEEVESLHREQTLCLALQGQIKERDGAREHHATDVRKAIANERASLLLQIKELQELKKAHVITNAQKVYEGLPPSGVITSLSSLSAGEDLFTKKQPRLNSDAEKDRASAVEAIVSNLSSVLLSANETLHAVSKIVDGGSSGTRHAENVLLSSAAGGKQ